MIKTDRPKLKIPRESVDIILELTVLVILLLIIVYAVVSYSSLPETVPTHFNAAGEVDGYGNKTSIWFLIGITIVLAAGMHWFTKYPHLHNYMVNITEENAFKNYRISNRLLRFVNVGTTLIMAYVAYSVIETAHGNTPVLNSYFVYIVIGIIVILPIVILVMMSKSNNKTTKL